MNKNAESAFLFNRKQEFRKKCVKKCRKKCVEKCKIWAKNPWKSVKFGPKIRGKMSEKSVERPKAVGNMAFGRNDNALSFLPKFYSKDICI